MNHLLGAMLARLDRNGFDGSPRPLHWQDVRRPPALFPALAITAACVCLTACRGAGKSGADGGAEAVRPSSTAVMSAAVDDQRPAPTKRPPKKPAGAGQHVTVPAGAMHAGSVPGDVGREPGLEVAWETVDLGGFEIDRLPYPNEPSQPPRTGVTRERAQALCAERGQRLCTELEWERACKGPDDETFSTGAGWDPACEQHPNECASGFDVLAMSAMLREWTSSSVEPSEEQTRTLGLLRGGRPKAADLDHRCARREPADPGAQGGDIGFRCCGGTANAAALKRPKPLAAFRKVQLDPSQVTSMIKSVPQLASLGEISFFKEPDDVNTVTDRGDGGKPSAILTTSALMWSPDLGEELLVIAGKSASGSSFVAAFYRLPEDRYRVASSFVLERNAGPIVLGFNGYTRTRLTWSTCWGCLGEEGAVIYRKNRRIIIEQL